MDEMTTEKRKQQLREAQKRYRGNQAPDGLVNFTHRIKREWRRLILDYIKGLK